MSAGGSIQPKKVETVYAQHREFVSFRHEPGFRRQRLATFKIEAAGFQQPLTIPQVSGLALIIGADEL